MFNVGYGSAIAKLRVMGFTQEEFEFIEHDESEFAHTWSRLLRHTEELSPNGSSIAIFAMLRDLIGICTI